jgi:hypothetical protein
LMMNYGQCLNLEKCYLQNKLKKPIQNLNRFFF